MNAVYPSQNKFLRKGIIQVHFKSLDNTDSYKDQDWDKVAVETFPAHYQVLIAQHSKVNSLKRKSTFGQIQTKPDTTQGLLVVDWIVSYNDFTDWFIFKSNTTFCIWNHLEIEVSFYIFKSNTIFCIWNHLEIEATFYPLTNKIAKGYSNATVRPSFLPSVRPSITSLWTL